MSKVMRAITVAISFYGEFSVPFYGITVSDQRGRERGGRESQKGERRGREMGREKEREREKKK
jgi:hypothetical protein